jgi:putative oxidoreductase
VQKLDLGLLVLRIVFGIAMMCHGWNKISSGLNGTSNWFASIGMKWPRLQAPLAAYSELLAGALMALGLLTGVSTTLFIALMIVAIMTVHAKVGFFIFLPNGGWEYCASIIGVAVAVSLTGPGKYSLDNFLDIPVNHSLWAIPCGVVLAVCHLAIAYRPQQHH